MFGTANGIVALMEFSDTTYSAISTLWSVTLSDSKVRNTVASNSYIIGISDETNPVFIRFSYDATTATSEVGTDFFAHTSPTFFALEAIASTNYVLSACLTGCTALDAYKVRRLDSVTFGAPDVLETSNLLNGG